MSRASRSSRNTNPDEEFLQPGKVTQVFTWRQTIWLAYSSVGIIYGDIGTSPLYCYSGIFSSPPSRQDVIGSFSLLFYALLMMVTIKYVAIVLMADNDGEGGTFSCYVLLSRYANISHRNPKGGNPGLNRYNTNELAPVNRAVRSTMEHSRFLKRLLKVVGVLAVTMVMADGVLTPAQSILGAVQGIQAVDKSIQESVVVGVTIAIIVLLFAFQPLGTMKLGVTFAPIIIIWLLFLAIIGIYNLTLYDHEVLKGLSPVFAMHFLMRHGKDGWLALSGVLLAFTGVEALFADLGAFSRSSIRLSWTCFCFPCLVLAYAGQAAYLAVKPEAFAYPAFDTMPNQGFKIFTIVIGLLAAIVASQAIITATFQLISQIVKSNFFPAVTIKHTSAVYHNHLYVPIANWLLCIGCIAVTAGFKNTNKLGAAYGVCVMFVTFFDTTMTTLVALIKWRLSPFIVVLPWLTFACLDGAFLSSALTKVPHGAYLTLAIATVLAMFLVLWRYGKEQQWRAEVGDNVDITEVVEVDALGRYRLRSGPDREALNNQKAFIIFFDKAAERTPIVFREYIQKVATLPDAIIYLHLRYEDQPTVPAERMFMVAKTELPGCYRVIIALGYMDDVITKDLASIVFDKVSAYIGRRSVRMGRLNEDEKVARDISSPPESLDKRPEGTVDETALSDLDRLRASYEHRVLYVVGDQDLTIKAGTGRVRRFLLESWLFVRRNTGSKVQSLNIPTDRTVVIGHTKDI